MLLELVLAAANVHMHVVHAFRAHLLRTQLLSPIRLIKTTAALNEVALSYHKVRELYFLAVVLATTIYLPHLVPSVTGFLILYRGESLYW